MPKTRHTGYRDAYEWAGIVVERRNCGVDRGMEKGEAVVIGLDKEYG